MICTRGADDANHAEHGNAAACQPSLCQGWGTGEIGAVHARRKFLAWVSGVVRTPHANRYGKFPRLGVQTGVTV